MQIVPLSSKLVRVASSNREQLISVSRKDPERFDTGCIKTKFFRARKSTTCVWSATIWASLFYSCTGRKLTCIIRGLGSWSYQWYAFEEDTSVLLRKRQYKLQVSLILSLWLRMAKDILGLGCKSTNKREVSNSVNAFRYGNKTVMTLREITVERKVGKL